MVEETKICELRGEKERREGLNWPSALSPRTEEVLACMQSEQWRDLIGDYEEAHNLRLPKTIGRSEQNHAAKEARKVSTVSKQSTPSRSRKSWSPRSRARRSTSPSQRRSIDRSLSPEPKGTAGERGQQDRDEDEEAYKVDKGGGEIGVKNDSEEEEEEEEEEEVISGGHEGEEEGQQGAHVDKVTLQEGFIFAEAGTLVGSAEYMPTDMGLATEGNATAEIELEQDAAAGASSALTAASVVARSTSHVHQLLLLPPAPPRVRVPVPTARCLRMLLSVLKHNPAGVVQEVGVLLMLHAAAIEVAKPTPTAADGAAGHPNETPSALVPAKSGVGGGTARARHQAHVKQREESAKITRRVDEAAAVLAVALTAVKTSGMRTRQGAGVAAIAKTKGGYKTRFRHQLRQPPKVEDGLQAWAATRGREVFGLRELLGLSAGESPIVQPATSHVQLVRDRVARISAGKVKKALPEASHVLEFISYAVDAVVGVMTTAGDSNDADTLVDLDRPSTAGGGNLLTGGKGESSVAGASFSTSSSDPKIWASTTSGSDAVVAAGDLANGGGRDGSPAAGASLSVSSSDPKIWASTSSDSEDSAAVSAGNIEGDGKDGSSVAGASLSASSSEPKIWESTTSDSEDAATVSAGNIKGDGKDEFPAAGASLSASSSKPKIWASTTSGSEQCADFAPGSLSAEDPVAWKPSMSGPAQRVEGSPRSLASHDTAAEIGSTQGSRTTSATCGGGDGVAALTVPEAPAFDSERDVTDSCLGLWGKQDADASPLVSPASSRDDAAVAAAGASAGGALVAVPGETPSLVVSPLSDDVVAAAATREASGGSRQLAAPRRPLFTLAESDDEDFPSSASSDNLVVVVWKRPKSPDDSFEPQKPRTSASGAGAADALVAADNVQEDSQNGEMWTVDPLGDIMGDTPLVTEDGERNAWDDILEEQLSKCRPLQHSADRSPASPLIHQRLYSDRNNGGSPITATAGHGSAAYTHDASSNIDPSSQLHRRESQAWEDTYGYRRREEPDPTNTTLVPETPQQRSTPPGGTFRPLELSPSDAPVTGGRIRAMLRARVAGRSQDAELSGAPEQRGLDCGAQGHDAVGENGSRGGSPTGGYDDPNIYWAEVTAGATREVAAEAAERAASAAEAYEQRMRTGRGGHASDEWLEARSSAIAAGSIARVAAATAARAAELKAASAPAAAQHGGGGGGGSGGGGGHHRLHLSQGEEDQWEQASDRRSCRDEPDRDDNTEQGNDLPSLSAFHRVDVNVADWDWSSVGGGRRMSDVGRSAGFLEGERGETRCGAEFLGGSSAKRATGFGTATTLRCGKAWGSIACESNLSVQRHVEKRKGNMGGSLAQLCKKNERKKWRREQRRRQPEVEGEFSLGPQLPQPTCRTTWSCQLANKQHRHQQEEKEGKEEKKGGETNERSLLGGAESALSAAGTESVQTPPLTPAALAPSSYRLSDQHAEMTKRWPTALLVASKSLIADVPGLEEHGRRSFEEALEQSVRRGVMGRPRSPETPR
ncbi:unnamed protein product [Ectocarpus sp. 4 AP-2014]